MNRADERIERVLAGLRETNTPADLDRRITEAVEKRLTAAGPGSAWFRQRGSVTGLLLPKLAFGAVAAAAVLCVAFGLRNPHRASDAAAAAHAANVQRASPAPLEMAGTAAVPQRPSVKQGVSRKRRVNVSAVRATRAETPLPARVRANRPAPPMPLTTQEKLLLQLAREGDPQEIAMLNPEVRAQQEREGKAEFNNFFETPRGGDNE